MSLSKSALLSNCQHLCVMTCWEMEEGGEGGDERRDIVYTGFRHADSACGGLVRGIRSVSSEVSGVKG